MYAVKVSVIVPVYNAGSFIQQCIRSLLDQTLQEMEIIVVNDGSTDDTIEKVVALAAAYPQIIFINTINQGVSAARNKGLQIAKGEFIGFVDADDWVMPAMYKTMYQNAQDHNADMVICNILAVEGKKKSTRLFFEDDTIHISANLNQELINLMRFKYDFANWNKLYSSRLIKEHGIFFDEQMTVYEDLLFNLFFWGRSEKAVLVNKAFYNYRIHGASVMNVSRHDKIAEFNALFSKFYHFCANNNLNEASIVCGTEMRRILYYSILPEIYKPVVQMKCSFSKRIKTLAVQLSKVDARLFSFPESELIGIQGFKKKLLQNRQFLLFSTMTLIAQKRS